MRRRRCAAYRRRGGLVPAPGDPTPSLPVGEAPKPSADRVPAWLRQHPAAGCCTCSTTIPRTCGCPARLCPPPAYSDRLLAAGPSIVIDLISNLLPPRADTDPTGLLKPLVNVPTGSRNRRPVSPTPRDVARIRCSVTARLAGRPALGLPGPCRNSPAGPVSRPPRGSVAGWCRLSLRAR